MPFTWNILLIKQHRALLLNSSNSILTQNFQNNISNQDRITLNSKVSCLDQLDISVREVLLKSPLSLRHKEDIIFPQTASKGTCDMLKYSWKFG